MYAYTITTLMIPILHLAILPSFNTPIYYQYYTFNITCITYSSHILPYYTCITYIVHLYNLYYHTTAITPVLPTLDLYYLHYTYTAPMLPSYICYTCIMYIRMYIIPIATTHTFIFVTYYFA